MLLDTVLYSSTLNPVGLAGLLLLISTLFFLSTSPKKSRLPLINEKKPSEYRYTNAGKRFLKDARSLIEEGLSKVGWTFSFSRRGFVIQDTGLNLTHISTNLSRPAPFALLQRMGLKPYSHLIMPMRSGTILRWTLVPPSRKNFTPTSEDLILSSKERELMKFFKMLSG